MFFFWASIYVYVPVLNVYAQHLGASLTLVGMVAGAYGLPQLLTRIPLGVWSDRTGKRKAFVSVGLVGGVLGAIGLVFSPNAWWLFFFRAVHGVTASTWVNASVLFASYFPPERATSAMSLVTFFNGLAMVLSAYGGGLLAERYDWVAPFWASAALALAALVCILPVSEEVGIKRNPISFGHFRSIASVPQLVTVSVIGALSQYTIWGTSYGFLPIYAASLHASKEDLGILTMVMQLPFALGTLVAAKYAAKFGDRMAVVYAMVLMGLASGVIPLVHNLPLLDFTQFLSGLGRGLHYPILMALTIKSVPQSERATAMGIFQAVYATGMVGGPWLSGVFAGVMGLENALYISAGVTLVGAAFALVKLAPAQRVQPIKG